MPNSPDATKISSYQEEKERNSKLIKIGDNVIYLKIKDDKSDKNVVYVGKTNPNNDMIPFEPEPLEALADDLERAGRLMRVWASYARSESQKAIEGSSKR